MPVRWKALEDAFLTVDASPLSAAWVHRATGEIRTIDDLVEQRAAPPSDDGAWLEIPSAETLELKTSLVRAFVRTHCPRLMEPVQRCFSGHGAWTAYRELLEANGLREAWTHYQAVATQEALRQWAQTHDLAVIDAEAVPAEAARRPQRPGSPPSPA